MSKALTVVSQNHPTDESESQRALTSPEPDPLDLIDVDHPRAPSAKEFLAHYRKTKRLTKAAEFTGIATNTYQHWRGKYGQNAIPGFPQAFDMVHDEVLAMLEDEAQAMAFDGVEELTYKRDKNGENERLAMRRVRQDPALVKTILGGKMPDKYGKADSAPQVNVVIVREQ